jgi:hypothetical protein
VRPTAAIADRALAVAGSEGVDRGRESEDKEEREDREGKEEKEERKESDAVVEVDVDIDVDIDVDAVAVDEGDDLGEEIKLDRSGMILSSEGKIDRWDGRRVGGSNAGEEGESKFEQSGLVGDVVVDIDVSVTFEYRRTRLDTLTRSPVKYTGKLPVIYDVVLEAPGLT